MIDYSLDIVEVAGEDRSKRGKRGGRKRLLQLEDGSHKVIPAGTPVADDALDLLGPIEKLLSTPPDVTTLRERVLDQLSTGEYGL